MKYKLLLLATFCFFIKNNYGQNNTDSILNIVAKDYIPEKIFIHFDKENYKPSETIWFKAYLTANGFQSSISKNFYIDWYNEKGIMIEHDAYPIINACTNGQYEIPKSYTGKALHAKAYTTWQLNFDTSFLFTKHFSIINDSLYTETKFISKPQINFFPEGGNLVAGIPSFVAFKANNQFGYPISITGAVTNNAGEFIDSLKTEHDGMGLFYLQNPNATDKYSIKWKDDSTGQSFVNELPTILNEGVSLQVEKINKFLQIKISRTNNVTEDQKIVKLQCTIGNNVVYSARVKLLQKNNHTVDLGTSELPNGIMQITIFNDNYLPLAERIVFVNNGDYSFKSTINTANNNLMKRAKNVFEVEVADTTVCNMSLAIVDENAAKDLEQNIYSYLLLKSDIKGYIHKPNYYFSSMSEDVQQHLDLVMLTSGWRKYDWQKIYNNSLPYVRFKKDTSYINLVGTLYDDLGKIQPNQEVLVMTETFDSLRKQFILPVSRKGVFAKNNIIFYDKLKLHYVFVGNKRLNPANEVVFTNGLFNYPTKNIIDTIIYRTTTYNKDYFDKLKQWDAEYKRLLKVKGSGMLEAVELKSRTKRKVDVMDERYTSSFFKGGDAVQLDLTDDLSAGANYDLFSYLVGRVAGINVNNGTVPPSVTWRGGSPSFYLDEIAIDPQSLQGMGLQDIAYIKAFRPPFFGGTLGGAGGAIALYSRRGEDVKSTTRGNVAFKTLEGYNVVKQFYSPNYEKETLPFDIRTTLYWNPYLVTNKENQKIKVEFFNNDITKKFKVVLCGVNQDGKLTWFEKTIE